LYEPPLVVAVDHHDVVVEVVELRLDRLDELGEGVDQLGLATLHEPVREMTNSRSILPWQPIGVAVAQVRHGAEVEHRLRGLADADSLDVDRARELRSSGCSELGAVRRRRARRSTRPATVVISGVVENPTSRGRRLAGADARRAAVLLGASHRAR
jgi:hypothetical protein